MRLKQSTPVGDLTTDQLLEEVERRKKEEDPMVQRTLYLHADRDSMWEQADELGLSEDAARKFSCALYEVEFDVVVDRRTGEVTVLSINVGDGGAKFVRDDNE